MGGVTSRYTNVLAKGLDSGGGLSLYARSAPYLCNFKPSVELSYDLLIPHKLAMTTLPTVGTKAGSSKKDSAECLTHRWTKKEKEKSKIVGTI